MAFKKIIYCFVSFGFILCANLPLSAVEFSDDFNTPHNYIINGTAGSGWDGFVGLGPNETIDKLNSSIDRLGKLFIQSHGARWEPNWIPLGPFLYKTVSGNFEATVKVTESSNLQWNDSGIMARVADISAAGAGEDFECVDHFPIIGKNMGRSVDSGTESEWGTTSLMPYLRLRREGNLFYHMVSSDGLTWITIPGSPRLRNDLNGLPLQVGLQQATYTSSTGFAAFDDFQIAPAVNMSMTNDYFDLLFSPTRGGISSFSKKADVDNVNYIASGKALGDLVIRYRFSTATNHGYAVDFGFGNYSLVNQTNFSDFTMDGDVTVASGAEAGLIFRVTNPTVGANNFNGYYLGLFTSSSEAILFRMDKGPCTIIGRASCAISIGISYHVKIVAQQSAISVYVDDMQQPKFQVSDSTYTSGSIGLRAYNASASFDNISAGTFSDDFESGSSRWTNYGGTWTIAEESSGWLQADTSAIDPNYEVNTDTEKIYSFLLGEGPDLKLTERFAFQDSNLTWSIQLKNLKDSPVEISDIVIPTIINTEYTGPTYQDTFRKRVNMHRYIAGHGSHIDWLRADGQGPHLLMNTQDGTKLEYFDRSNTAYIHSACSGPAETRGTWRQPHTSVNLNAAGTSGDDVNYGFIFGWADDYDGARDVLYANRGFDIHVVPGMSLPLDLEAKFSLRTKNVINYVTAEFPASTAITYLGDNGIDVHLYKVSFSRLGENMITVNYGNNRHLLLEFFVTEPLETLIKKRSSFIVNSQQHRNPAKWYNGLYSLWDMRNQVLRSPDDTGGLMTYMVGGSDDPSSGGCVFLSEKNTAFPDTNQIASLEYFIENFVWGKHQRTDTETPFPYGIYGSNVWLDGCANWYDCRNSPYGFGSGGKGLEHLWRTYDYTHYITIYYNMYRIAKMYPDKVHYLDAAGYLQRAYGTAMAFFEVPYNIHCWGIWVDWAYKFGNFHEKYIPKIVDALESEGRVADANWLRGEWEKKVKFMIYDDQYPYGSEFYIDRTAFESTYALAKYGALNPLTPDVNLWQDKNTGQWYSHPSINLPDDAIDFMHRQLAVNIALRGWLETNYYYLGSATTQNTHALCYMSQMAGWSILDYALNFAPEGDAEKYARLGYASILSSWALINSGTAASNYGYWFPGLANDGATGWAFEPTKYGPTWGVGDVPRGIWHYDGEINHGLTGGVNAACTVVCDDPIFGLFAYGGSLNQQDGKISVVPADGLRQKFYIKIGDCRVHIEFERDGFAQNTPVIFNNPVRFLHFTLENRTADTHTTKLSLSGLERGCYRLMVNNVTQYSFRIEDSNRAVLDVTVGSSLTYDITVSLAADIDGDSDVDFKDFALFALQWQEDNSNPCFGADLTGDGIVNEEDLEKILNCWLM